LKRLYPQKSLEVLSIIIPVYNEGQSLPIFFNILEKNLEKISKKAKVNVLFINNGSSDDSLELIKSFRCDGIELGVITLSRNFGYEVALFAGLELIDSDIYCMLDADGEDPSGLLEEFLRIIQQEGQEIAIGIRGKRHEGILTKVFRRFGYVVLSKISDEPFWRNAGNFSMFTRQVRDAVIHEKSSFPFLRSRFSASGYSARFVAYDREPRIDGKSKYRKMSLAKFAIAGFLTTTTWPLRLNFYSFVMFVLMVLAFIPAQAEIFNDVSDLLFKSLVLLNISFISLYVARIYKDTNRKKLYHIDFEKSFGTENFPINVA
jgi:glycosyltransferase involved in cell wall biosynthesis